MSSFYPTKAYLAIDKSYPKNLRDKFKMQRMDIEFLPSEIQEGGSPQYAQIEVLGRWAPYQVFSGAQASTYSFKLDLYAHHSPRLDVVDRANFIRSLRYPIVDGVVTYPPPVS